MPAGRHSPDDAGRVRAPATDRRVPRADAVAGRRVGVVRGRRRHLHRRRQRAQGAPHLAGRAGLGGGHAVVRAGGVRRRGRSHRSRRPPGRRRRPGGGRRELGRPPVRGVPGARPPPAPDAGRRELLGGGGRRLPPRLPVQVLGLRVHHRRTALRRVGPAPVAPGLAGHGRHAHRHLRPGGRRVRVAVEAQPRRDRGGRARLRRARGGRPRRHRRRHAAVPVQHGVVHLATVGVRRDVGRREVPGRGGVLQQLRHGRGCRVAGRAAVLVAGADPGPLARRGRPRRTRPVAAARNGDAGAGARWRSTAGCSSSACAG